MNCYLSKTTRSTAKLPRHFSISRFLLWGLALLSSSLLIASLAPLASAAEPGSAQAQPAAPIAQIVVTGKRMTAEQKRQFDEAETLARKNAGIKVAGVQDSRK